MRTKGTLRFRFLKKKITLTEKQTEGKGFNSEGKDWTAYGGNSEDEEYINLALMVKTCVESSSSISQVLTTKIFKLTKDECKLIIDEMSNELYNLHMSLKSLTKKNFMIKRLATCLKKEFLVRN